MNREIIRTGLLLLCWHLSALVAYSQFSPGMAVLHSKDLENWTIISHVANDLTAISPGPHGPVRTGHLGGFYSLPQGQLLRLFYRSGL